MVLVFFGVAILLGITGATLAWEKNEDSFPPSDDCTDFDPCTWDVIEDLGHPEEEHHHHFDRSGALRQQQRSKPQTSAQQLGFEKRDDDDDHHEECRVRVCRHFPMAEGSCCNREDYCYTYDHHKRCHQGICKSRDVTKCKGYCVSSEDCPVLPLVINGSDISAFCFYGSCVTIAFVLYNPGDPNLLLNQSAYPPIGKLEACLASSCVWLPDNGYYSCTYVWRCAPWVNASTTISSAGATAAAANTPAIVLPGMPFTKNYQAVNQHLYSRIQQSFTDLKLTARPNRKEN